MKKYLLIVSVACAALLSSCGSIQSGMVYTATPVDVPTTIVSSNVADLEVGDRVTFRYTPTSQVRAVYPALANCKAAAIASMLKNYNADVIVAPEYSYDSDLNVIEVTGRPAKYKNFRAAK